MLSRVDRGEERLDALVPYTVKDTLDLWGPVSKANLAKGAMTVEAMCKAAVEISDGVCANLLMARSGGPLALTAFLRSIGERATRIEHYEPQFDRVPSGGPADSTTPAMMASTLQKAVLGNVLSDQSKALLTRWLVGNQTNPGCGAACPGVGGSATRPATAVTWPATSPSPGLGRTHRSSSRSTHAGAARPRSSSIRRSLASGAWSRPSWLEGGGSFEKPPDPKGPTSEIDPEAEFHDCRKRTAGEKASAFSESIEKWEYELFQKPVLRTGAP